jgi:hypothetical protein
LSWQKEVTMFAKAMVASKLLVLVWSLLLATTLVEMGAAEKFKKGIDNAKNRMVVVAGLDGAGHELLTALFKACVDATKDSKDFACHFDAKMQKLLFEKNRQNNGATQMTGLFFAHSHVSKFTTAAGMKMAGLASGQKDDGQEESFKGSFLHVVGLSLEPNAGTMTYPMGEKDDRSVFHPDMRILAQLADENGMDLRILVLLRDAQDTMHASLAESTFGFQNIQKPSEEPRNLVNNADVLYSQLSNIDQKFYKCVDYEQLATQDPVAIKELLEYVHPALVDDSLEKPMLAAMAAEVPKSRKMASDNKREPKDANERVMDAYFDMQLTSRQTLIKRLCSATD